MSRRQPLVGWCIHVLALAAKRMVQTLIAGNKLGIADRPRHVNRLYPLCPSCGVCLRLSRRNTPQAQKWRGKEHCLWRKLQCRFVSELGYGFEGPANAERFCFVSELFSFEPRHAVKILPLHRLEGVIV